MAPLLRHCSASKLTISLTLPYLFYFLLLLRLIGATSTANVIDTLPGYSGTLPFKMETGYISVGEDEDAHELFYYFFESERDPRKDPLLLWLAGGPGCSGFTGLAHETGPLKYVPSSFAGSLPSLIYNPYSWTTIANIIFIDSPVGTGFSYANTSQGYSTSDSKSAMYDYVFLRKWLLNHPSFIKNDLYIAGNSYGGKRVTMVASEIVKGNEAGLEPLMSLRGYITGNGVTDVEKDTNERVPFAHRMALISDEYYHDAKISCNGEYENPDPQNVACLGAMHKIKECIKNVNMLHILEPKCDSYASIPDDSKWPGQMILGDDPHDFLFLSKKEEYLWCRKRNYWPLHIWANDPSVREALHVKKGTKKEWQRCNYSLSYEKDVQSAFEYHQLLNEKGLEGLAYSGDHDMGIPYLTTLKWIRDLNLSTEDYWRPWLVDGQIAGYVEKYQNNGAYLTFATVKGAGHTPPEYMPNQCLAMINRWLSLYPL